MGFLIDTCIWVDVERGAASPSDVQMHTGDEPVFISPVTIAELTFGIEMAANESIRNSRRAALDRLRIRPILCIDETTGHLFGTIAASLRQQGRTGEYRVQDLWLAAQAIQHDFRFLTRNRKDFEDIPGLRLELWRPPGQG